MGTVATFRRGDAQQTGGRRPGPAVPEAPCCRQNLEAHARAGLLPYSTVSMKPLRFHPLIVSGEIEANAGPPVIAATGTA